jgi:hypothetical protein
MLPPLVYLLVWKRMEMPDLEHVFVWGFGVWLTIFFGCAALLFFGIGKLDSFLADARLPSNEAKVGRDTALIATLISAFEVFAIGVVLLFKALQAPLEYWSLGVVIHSGSAGLLCIVYILQSFDALVLGQDRQMKRITSDGNDFGDNIID